MEKTGAESRLEERLMAMKDSGLFLREQVCLGSGFPCAYIYKTNLGLQQHQDNSDANTLHHPALQGRGSGLGSTCALVVLATGFQHGGRPDADSAVPARALPSGSAGPGAVAVSVKGQFNTPPVPPSYRKTMKQLEGLERFFQAGKANKRDKVSAEAENLAMSTRKGPETGRRYYS